MASPLAILVAVEDSDNRAACEYRRTQSTVTTLSARTGSPLQIWIVHDFKFGGIGLEFYTSVASVPGRLSTACARRRKRLVRVVFTVEVPVAPGPLQTRMAKSQWHDDDQRLKKLIRVQGAS